MTADDGNRNEYKVISTHTLTWSVTIKSTNGFYIHYNISTHTLTWSVTPDCLDKNFDKFNFNSHAHVERDT